MPAQLYPDEERRAANRFSMENVQGTSNKTSNDDHGGNGKNGKKKSRVKYIVIACILLLIALFVFILAMWAKSGTEEDPYDDVKDVYSASRFFCRLKYPNKWEIVPGENGFYIDSETGLFLKAYPYDEEAVVYESEAGSQNPASATPEPIKIPIEGVLFSAYYKEIDGFEWPESTAETAVTPAPYDLDEAGGKAKEMIEGMGAKDLTSPEKFAGKHCTFLRYKYVKDDGTKGEMFVCSRAMAYYIFTYEATEEQFNAYETPMLSMVNNIELSVFKY